MAKYVSVKGWIECEHSQVEKIKKIILSYESNASLGDFIKLESIRLYNKGWYFPKESINWNAYIFYGADVKEYCLEFIEEELKEVLRKNIEISGMFFFQYEEGEERCWKIVESEIVEIEMPN